jgi:diaminohydroxyphosphoribosylaminopyrimidine deaminase/5-amino-6-(5-phosphoribosylamino)uracil reductase
MAKIVEGEGGHGKDRALMQVALRRARAGLGSTYPNPSVGAVVARGGRVVAAASSGPTGSAHAEVRAIERAGDRARAATLYVTLEPCRHFGLTPPCTEAIIAAGIREVVVGARDPARHARGRGIARLVRAGIRVREGICADECLGVHEHYLHHERTGRPFVTLKAAVSLDGQIACASGKSRWITGEAARRHAHGLRAAHHGVAVGAGTVLADDPALDVRGAKGVDPVRVIFDSRLRTALVSPKPRVLGAGCLVLHTGGASPRARRQASAAGAETIEVDADASGQIAVAAALEALGRRPLRSLLVEGGGGLHAAFVRARAWQRLYLYQAPRLLGAGVPLLRALSWASLTDAPRLRVVARRALGEDVLTVWEPA